MRRVRRALLAWFARHKRDLPWRRTRDPYAIWLSETMLQQTRVETVIPYYERFLARFPTVFALADAPADEVTRLWSGLGYYSRVRNLHAAAREIAREHGGELPREVETLRGLPGVGRYTAGAVASIAFDRPAPIVDGNVARVLARLLDLRDDVRSPPVQQRLWQEAAALADGPRPGDLNQALMELGALVCTPRAPKCLLCPLREMCRGLAAGDPEALPVKKRARAPRAIEGVAAIVTRERSLLAVRRPPQGLLGGLWDLPGGDLSPREAAEAALERALRERLGLAVAGVVKLGEVQHQFTHRTLRLHVFRAKAKPGRVARSHYDAHRWLSAAAFQRLGASALARKALALHE
ncbi:MAG TPA: A/G-specific adenine glycosylase [Myxococcota bacterium]|nr:A/G-specific adenine glycosylase [Myxococcota bacterium]